jgi:hypothetical protein
MTPFSYPSTPSEEKFNKCHAKTKTRVLIEQTFGILKKRFACLLALELHLLKDVILPWAVWYYTDLKSKNKNVIKFNKLRNILFIQITFDV